MSSLAGVGRRDLEAEITVLRRVAAAARAWSLGDEGIVEELLEALDAADAHALALASNQPTTNGDPMATKKRTATPTDLREMLETGNKPKRPRPPPSVFIAIGPHGELPEGVARRKRDTSTDWNAGAEVQGPFVLAERVKV